MITIDSVFGVLAPNLCIVCGTEGYVLCNACLDTAGDPVAPRCVGCHKLSDDFNTCSTCKRWLGIESVYVSTSYDGVYEQIIHELKFEVKRQTAYPIAHIMSEQLQGTPRDYILCPIPTAPSRIRERGFDHVKLIVEHLSRFSKLEQKQLLSRKTNARQVGSSRSDRFKHMEQEFYTKYNDHVEGKNILLVDDVFTTGATLSGAARSLKSAGAKSVSAIVFAQKV